MKTELRAAPRHQRTARRPRSRNVDYDVKKASRGQLRLRKVAAYAEDVVHGQSRQIGQCESGLPVATVCSAQQREERLCGADRQEPPVRECPFARRKVAGEQSDLRQEARLREGTGLVDQRAVPTVSREKPLDARGPPVEQARIRELLVNDQPLRGGDTQGIGCFPATGMDLVVQLLGATMQSCSHAQGISSLSRDD